eukprot:c8690_g1_i2.p2 GENE.c8690_g1_i2~~c8690_g1_i2.p2  ORF type:complete len:146 (-),score=46.06 c8690_g1_i2:50-487(-)
MVLTSVLAIRSLPIPNISNTHPYDQQQQPHHNTTNTNTNNNGTFETVPEAAVTGVVGVTLVLIVMVMCVVVCGCCVCLVSPMAGLHIGLVCVGSTTKVILRPQNTPEPYHFSARASRTFHSIREWGDNMRRVCVTPCQSKYSVLK